MRRASLWRGSLRATAPTLAAAIVLVLALSPQDPPQAGAGALTLTAATLSFAPVADARAEAALPNTNFGTTTSLTVDSSPQLESFLRFNLTGIDGPVSNARLRLYVTDGSANGPAVYTTTNAAWTETTLTWATRPTRTGTAHADAASVPNNRYYEYDLTTAVTGNGPLSLALIPTSSDGLQAHSREGTSPPQLVVTVDHSPPGVAITAPANGTTVTSSPVTLQATASDDTGVTRVEFHRNGVLAGTDTTTPYTHTWTPSRADNGTHTWTATAVDRVGRSTVSSSISLGVAIPLTSSRTFAPVADARAEAALPNTNFGTTTSLTVDSSPQLESFLRFNLTGIDGPVSNARLRLYVTDGSANGPAVYTTTNAAWTETTLTWATRPTRTGTAHADAASVPNNRYYEYDLTTAVTGNGPLSLALIPTSSDGLQAHSREGTSPPQLVVTVIEAVPDTTPPTVALTGPAAGTVFTAPDPIAIEATASDDTGVTRVEFHRNGVLAGTDTTTPYTHTWTPSRADNGTQSFTATALDAAGNTKTTPPAAITIAIPGTPPTVLLTAPANGTVYTESQTVTLAADATDDDGIAHVEFHRNGALAGTDTTAPYTQQWTPIRADNGTHTWTATAVGTDTAATTSTALELIVAIPDRTFPTVTVTGPADGAVLNAPGTVNVEAVAGDDDAVARVEFQRNGVSAGTDATAPYAVSWAFTAADAGAHTWTAIATDASGNATTSAPVRVVVVAAQSGTVRVTPNADGRVDSATPTTNYGSSSALAVDSAPSVKESYLRFSVTGAAGTIERATLRLWVTGGSVDGPALYRAETGWSEAGLTWDARPNRIGAPLGDLGAVATGTWIEYDVTPAVTGNGLVGFALIPTSSDGVDLRAREGTPPPELVLAVLDTPPTVALTAPADGVKLATSPIQLAAAAEDDVAVARVEFHRNGALAGSDTTAPFTHEWAPVRGDNGLHTWTATAVDSSGNSATSTPVRIELAIPDPNPPTVALTAPADGTAVTTTAPVQLEAEAFDDEAVGRVEFRIDGLTVASDTTPPYTHAWAPTYDDNGSHSWTARAYDAWGTATVSSQVTIAVRIAEVVATAETEPVTHGGDAADDAAIWIDTADPARSTIIVTDKLGGLAVHDLAGSRLQLLSGGTPNNVDLRPDFPLGGESVALVAVSDRQGDLVRFYRVDPATRNLVPVGTPLAPGLEPYGLCSYRNAAGKHYIFVTDRLGALQQWELRDGGTGSIEASLVRALAVGSNSEGCVADDQRGSLYVAEKAVGIWRYGAEPESGGARTLIDATGTGGSLDADVEGLALYERQDGSGYLLASSSGSNRFVVYDRGPENRNVGSFAIAAGAVDGASGTDGVAITSADLGFAGGLLVAQDDVDESGNGNFKLVAWDRIAAALEAGRRPMPGSCDRPYAGTSPWNTPIGAAPVYDPQGAFRLTSLQGRLTSDARQYTYPVYEVSAATPRRPVTLSGWFSDVSDGGQTLTNQRRGTVLLPIPEGAAPADGADAQIVLFDPATGEEWGISSFGTDATGLTGWNAYHYNAGWSAVPPRDADARPFFPRGAGLPYLAGLVRPCELLRGRIDHALAFAYDYPSASFIYPATKSDGNGLDPEDLPEGARLQLDPTLTEAEIRGWGCVGSCLTIALALQEYGMYVIDNAGREKIYLEYEGTARWGRLANPETTAPIPLTAFRLLDLAATPPAPGP